MNKRQYPQILVSLLLSMALLLPGLTILTGPVVAVASTAPIINTFTISSQKGWQQTSVYLKAGNSFKISHTGGAWTVDYANYPYVGPEGYPSNIDNRIAYGYKVILSLPYGTLLGKVGNGNIFAVGNKTGPFTADCDGYLFLRINDTEAAFADNRGSLNVSILYYPGQFTLTATSPTTAIVGSGYFLPVTIAGGTLPYTWWAPAKPSWLSLNAGGPFGVPTYASTGGLFGIPTFASTVKFTVQVKDNTGTTASKDLIIIVSPFRLTDDQLKAQVKQYAVGQGEESPGNLQCVVYAQHRGLKPHIYTKEKDECAYNLLYKDNDAATAQLKPGIKVLRHVSNLSTVLQPGDFIVWNRGTYTNHADSYCGHIAVVELVEASRVVIRQANNSPEFDVLQTSYFDSGEIYGYPHDLP